MGVIWRYVLVVDDGLSPCIEDGMLTLARRKPALRGRAQRGDWVLAMASRTLHPHGRAIAWAGRVSASLPLLDYSRRYPDRADALPLPAGSGAMAPLAGDGPLQSVEGRRALIFEPFWYWSNRSAVTLDDAVAPFAHSFSGARNRHQAEERIGELEHWLSSLASPGVHGQPSDKPGLSSGRRIPLRDQ